MTKLQNIKKLAISTLIEHKSAYNYDEKEMANAVKIFEAQIDKIIKDNDESRAFDEIAYFTKREHELHKEFLKWSDDEIESSLTELSIEISNI